MSQLFLCLQYHYQIRLVSNQTCQWYSTNPSLLCDYVLFSWMPCLIIAIGQLSRRITAMSLLSLVYFLLCMSESPCLRLPACFLVIKASWTPNSVVLQVTACTTAYLSGKQKYFTFILFQCQNLFLVGNWKCLFQYHKHTFLMLLAMGCDLYWLYCLTHQQ